MGKHRSGDTRAPSKARSVLGSAGRVALKVGRKPGLGVKHLRSFLREARQIARAESALAPPPGDRRFADPTWSERRWSKAMVQLYLAAGREILDYVGELGFEGREASAARFVTSAFIDSVAPSNNPFTNPVVLSRVRATRGRSLLRGLQNFISDQLDNDGLISMSDRSGFEVGRNLACTPGDVVLRTELFELIQYKPQTAEVYEIPLLVVPPQINKYYVLDLSPSNSFVNDAVKRGFQVFMISWKSPGPDQRDLSLFDYVKAVDRAHAAVMEISGATKVSFKGLCAGGITASIALGRMVDQGRGDAINALTLNVTLIDIAAVERTNMAFFLTPERLQAACDQADRDGVMPGRSMASMFAWLRPNDLIWSYWVNNYLMGEKPAPFDILFWNSQSTRLPAGLLHDFVELIRSNDLGRGKKYRLPDATVDLSRIEVDSFVVAGRTDHITPWDSCYKSVKLLGGKSHFLLVNSGHIQTLVCPPGKGKASFQTGKSLPDDPQEWLARSTPNLGSWWELWAGWMARRSGRQRAAPTAPGSAGHPALCAAPGQYVLT